MTQLDHDAIIIGAGICGTYMLHKLLGLGLDATVLETGEGPGGTWYWNRYPGARFDSESYSYGFSFSKEILQEWNWSEHFAAQPETLSYVNFVVDKLGLRDHMQFDCRVQSTRFDNETDTWTVATEDGRELTCRFLFTAIGMLSAATLPRIEGVDDFRGQHFHTYYAPAEPVAWEGKRVAVVGTGATGVQVIGAIAPKVKSLTVYQRRPNWCAPLNNAPIDAAEMARIKASYDDIFAQCRSTPNGFLHGPVRKDLNEVPEEERLAFWNELYASPGFGVWLGNYRDVLIDKESNALFSEFIADKIRQRVHDPVTAEKLIPKDHGFGTRRVPMETNYYEAYNLDHVELVDINETPIQRVTPEGIETTDGIREFDIIVYATGFDAITGAFDRIGFEGEDGNTLREHWAEEPLTYLGVQSSGFPNLFILAGPQAASVATNFPPAIETAVEWATDLMAFAKKHNLTRIETTPEAEQEWFDEVKSVYDMSLLTTTQSWFTGYNSNVEGHDRLRHVIYLGGAPAYRQRLAEVAENGYTGFVFH